MTELTGLPVILTVWIFTGLAFWLALCWGPKLPTRDKGTKSWILGLLGRAGLAFTAEFSLAVALLLLVNHWGGFFVTLEELFHNWFFLIPG